ncbi:MAG: hypothetical protein ACK4RV_06715 [Caulobacter sp.]|jgi:hypothetical protein
MFHIADITLEQYALAGESGCPSRTLTAYGPQAALLKAGVVVRFRDFRMDGAPEREALCLMVERTGGFVAAALGDPAPRDRLAEG